jgi:hypothetical protein
VKLYARVAGSQLGSSILFGGAFFAAGFATDGFAEALTSGSLAAAAWFAIVPVLKRVAGAGAA